MQDGTQAHHEGRGYELACEMVTNQVRVACYDTVVDFGFFTEIVEEMPGFLKQIAAIAKTCETWDGSDPIRLLSRDGYRTPAA